MKEHIFARPDNGDVDQGWALLAVCWAFVTCAFISTALRVWVRMRLTRNLGWDDYNMMIAMVSAFSFVIVKVKLVGRLGHYSTFFGSK